MDVYDRPAPELQTMPLGLYDVTQLAILGAFFALFAYFVHSWNSKEEVSVRYRPSVLAGLSLSGVAMVAYALLYSNLRSGFHLQGNVYVPSEAALYTIGTRYIDWSITVPLLMVELLAVCSLAGAEARRLRFTTMAASFLMIVTGYIGSTVAGQGRDIFALVVWGTISSGFLVYLYVALIGVVRNSLPTMGTEAAASLRNATIVLLGSFGIYPLVYAIPVFVDVTPAWFTAIQVGYSATDVVAKVGFGVLIHKVAKLRTAEDVVAGVDTHPESLWRSNVHLSDAVLPERRRVSPDLVARLRAGEPAVRDAGSAPSPG